MSSTFLSEAPTAANDWLSTGKQFVVHQNEQLTIDQLLQLMNQVNTSVRSGLFNTQLATQIFSLCQQLKLNGHILETSHKHELNRVFISLRQACCRDNGQLGTPCRLKMMELVELRAMGWRPSLAHTQYYLNRPEQNQRAQQSPVSEIQHQYRREETPMTASLTSDTGLPTSAPPFGNVPISPFARFAPPPQTIFVGSDGTAMPQIVAPPPQPTSFYLIPAAAGGWLRPMMTNQGVVSPENFIPQTPQIDIDAWARSNKLPSMKIKPKNATNKPPQIRDELVIRNSDSGKIMGVKGRRVAVVEELSNTVISFQKVDPKSKDRTLTITGATKESIEYAKRLIEQTIRRNVSPNRSDNETTELDDAEDDDVGISIETTRDGTLKLSCADPQVLQAAQAALSDYLTRVGRNHSKLTAQEKEERKERRKSMPLQSSSSSSSSNSHGKVKWRSTGKTGSTPNLAATAASTSHGANRYSRSQMIEIQQTPTELDPKTMSTLRELNILRG